MVRRLYLKALWLKKTYSFILAHKPLCHHYREDVIKIGGVYLCRSCSCAYCGIVFGLTLPYLMPVLYGHYSKTSLIVLMSLIFPLSHPSVYKRLHRGVRDLLRFSLGVLLAAGGRVLLEGSLFLGTGIFVLCFIVWKVYYSKRATRKIEKCRACDEYSEEKICPGYVQQAQCIREYEECATEYILKTGYVPKQLK